MSKLATPTAGAPWPPISRRRARSIPALWAALLAVGLRPHHSHCVSLPRSHPVPHLKLRRRAHHPTQVTPMLVHAALTREPDPVTNACNELEPKHRMRCHACYRVTRATPFLPQRPLHQPTELSKVC